MAQLTLEMPESAFGTLHPFTESAEKTAWVFSDGGIRNIRLLPASRVGFRGICKELTGGLRGASRFFAEGSPECGFLLS
jgi:hypothetical protein